MILWEKRAGRRVSALAAALVVAATASASHAALTPVQVTDDRFSPDIKLLGPEIRMDPFIGINRDWRLRTFISKKTGVPDTQLYVHIEYVDSDWRFYETANDDTAATLNLLKISSAPKGCIAKIHSCTFDEDVVVELDPAVLKEREGKIYEVKLSSKSGDGLIIAISAEQIAMQLAAIRDAGESLADKAAGRVTLPKPLPPQGEGASVQVAQGGDVVLATARKVLEAQGYALEPMSADGTSFSTLPTDHKFTQKEADCGTGLGIPFLWDSRTKTRVSITVSVAPGRLTVRSGMDGILEVRGFGAHEDKPLSCTTKDAFAGAVLQRIQAALPQP
jgi:hypothetical protein